MALTARSRWRSLRRTARAPCRVGAGSRSRVAEVSCLGYWCRHSHCCAAHCPSGRARITGAASGRQQQRNVTGYSYSSTASTTSTVMDVQHLCATRHARPSCLSICLVCARAPVDRSVLSICLAHTATDHRGGLTVRRGTQSRYDRHTVCILPRGPPGIRSHPATSI
jgi:hypothetical protein